MSNTIERTETEGLSPSALQSRREALGMTHAAIADALQTPISTWYDWIRGVTKPPGCLELALKYLECRK